MIELAAPRPLNRGESIQVQIKTGPLPRGARLTLMTERGEILGAVTPFGPSGERDGSTATVPIPRTAMSDGRLRLQLQVTAPGMSPRPPRADEIRGLDVVLSPASE
jgi:hypothetical protein